MIISQRKLFATLIRQVENQLGILAILASEDVLPLEHWGVEAAATERGKAILDYPFYVLATEHLRRTVISCSLMAHIYDELESCTTTRFSMTYLRCLQQQTLLLLP